MTPSPSRAALSLLLLVGLVAGCATGKPHGVSAISRPAPSDSDQAIIDDPIVKLLRAKTPGLVITRSSDGGIAVQVMQGPTSFYSSDGPLFLLDDVPFRPGAGGELTGINPYDIESIRFLKRPEEIGLYGVRGANGVILIKTKKPGRSGV
jgi:TonB-dependent SusC/RagA subfamily outer membrane receptor